MAEWLSKVMGALGGQGEANGLVREALLAAHRSRAKVALESAGGSDSAVMTTVIEQVRADDVVITQPAIGGLTHPLAFGEDMRMSFVIQALYHSAPTRCLGRIKIPSGAGMSGRYGPRLSRDHMLFAYRLALPGAFKVEDRRQQPRVQIGIDIAPEAQLYATSVNGPLLGMIVDISMSGARIRTPLAQGKLEAGQSMYLKAMLPEPVGLLDELVDISRLDVDVRRGQHIIGVTFRRRIEGLEEFIRSTQETRDLRRRTG